MTILTIPDIEGEYLNDDDFINAPKKTLKFRNEESALRYFLNIFFDGGYDPKTGNLYLSEHEERPVGTLLSK